MRGLGAKTIAIREAIKEIIEAIQPASVRAVCYKLFVRQLIADMFRNSTNGVGRHLVDMREQDDVPWSWVVDETRKIEKSECWNNLVDHYNENDSSYARDHWQDQPERVIIASEKGTVRGTLEPVLHELKVPLLVGHGYNSATLAHDLAQRARKCERPMRVLYVGDHDPSGMHMSEVDLPERLNRYGGAGKFQIIRVAVKTTEVPTTLPFSANYNMKNPNRLWYLRHFGEQCAELDAVDPPTLRNRVRDAVLAHIDAEAWARGMDKEKDELARLAAAHDQIVDILNGDEE